MYYDSPDSNKPKDRKVLYAVCTGIFTGERVSRFLKVTYVSMSIFGHVNLSNSVPLLTQIGISKMLHVTIIKQAELGCTSVVFRNYPIFRSLKVSKISTIF